MTCTRCKLRECRPTGATCWECLPPRDGDGYGVGSGISSFEHEQASIEENKRLSRRREEAAASKGRRV